jgi:hypothetical protein
MRDCFLNLTIVLATIIIRSSDVEPANSMIHYYATSYHTFFNFSRRNFDNPADRRENLTQALWSRLSKVPSWDKY